MAEWRWGYRCHKCVTVTGRVIPHSRSGIGRSIIIIGSIGRTWSRGSWILRFTRWAFSRVSAHLIPRSTGPGVKPFLFPSSDYAAISPFFTNWVRIWSTPPETIKRISPHLQAWNLNPSLTLLTRNAGQCDLVMKEGFGRFRSVSLAWSDLESFRYHRDGRSSGTTRKCCKAKWPTISRLSDALLN